MVVQLKQIFHSNPACLLAGKQVSSHAMPATKPERLACLPAILKGVSYVMYCIMLFQHLVARRPEICGM